MKKCAFVLCVWLLIALAACDNPPTVAHIDGRLLLSEGIEPDDVLGEQLYLYHTLGISVVMCVDTCCVASDLTYAFNDFPFGAYMITIGGAFALDPDTLVFRMSEEHDYVSQDFRVVRE